MSTTSAEGCPDYGPVAARSVVHMVYQFRMRGPVCPSPRDGGSI